MNRPGNLKKRLILWLHRTIIRLSLLKGRTDGRPERNTEASGIGAEQSWAIFRIGVVTLAFVLVIDILILVTWWFVRPSPLHVFLGTLILLAVNAAAVLWAIDRMRAKRRDQWSDR